MTLVSEFSMPHYVSVNKSPRVRLSKLQLLKNPLTDTKVIKSALKSGERGYLPFPSPGRKAG